MLDFAIMILMAQPMMITGIICYTIYKVKKLKKEADEDVRDN